MEMHDSMLAFGLDWVETRKRTTLSQVIFILKRRDGSIITVRGKKQQLPTPTWGEGGMKCMGVCFEHTQDQANIQYSV